jgi:hypothetical protein
MARGKRFSAIKDFVDIPVISERRFGGEWLHTDPVHTCWAASHWHRDKKSGRSRPEMIILRDEKVISVT